MAIHLITGGAGFIGVNLARALVGRGEHVVIIDDMSRGRPENLGDLADNPKVSVWVLDCTNALALVDRIRALSEVPSAIWHMAANSDIPAGIADPRIDLSNTFLTTFGILEAMKTCGVPTLNFASSSAIYGDFGDTVIHEDIGPLEPISNYGAMKLASEAQIRAAVEAFLPRANIFRFPNVIGTPATHGVIWDFCRKLKDTPGILTVLGDGSQQKAYLHVDDLVAAMLKIASLDGTYRLFNIGPTDDGVTVRFIAETVRDRAAPSATIQYGQGGRGWVGDVPKFRYSVDRLLGIGWSPTRTSSEAVIHAVDEIVRQELSV